MLLFPSLAPPLATLQTGAGIYFTRGKKQNKTKKSLSDHPCTPKAPPEPYGKGSSAPAVITDAKAVRPPCSSSGRLRSDEHHADVGSFQQPLQETQDPRQEDARPPAGPQGRALLPGAGGTPTLTGGPRARGRAARCRGDMAPVCSAGSTGASPRKPPAVLPLLCATNTRFKYL